MPTDPSISLNVGRGVTPIEDPLTQAGKALSVRGMMQQQQGGALQLQQQQIEMRDQQSMRDAYMKSGGDMDKFQSLAMQAGVSSHHIGEIQKQVLDHREGLAKLDETELGNQKKTTEAIGSNAQSLLAMPDEPTRATQWPTVRAQMIQQGHAKPEQIPEQYPGQQWVQGRANAAVTADQQIGNVLKDKADKRAAALQPGAIEKQQGEITAQAAALPGIVAGSTTKEQEAAGTVPIQPAQAATLAGTEAGRAETARHNAADETVAKARLADEQVKTSIQKHVFDQTYGAGANVALQGVEPKLRVQATTMAQKAAATYQTAMASDANVQTFIDLAQKGNKAAGSNLPIMGAETIQALNGIKRINRTEIEQYQGAGNLLDHIQGKLGKLVSGQPIPKDVMDDISNLHKALSGNATTTYNNALDGINQNYHSQFKPVPGRQQPAASAPSAAPAHVIEMNGKHYKYNGAGATDDIKSYSEVQ